MLYQYKVTAEIFTILVIIISIGVGFITSDFITKPINRIMGAVNAVEEGRSVYENIRKFITYIFASNKPEAVPYLAYILLKIPLPLTSMQILAVDLGTDMLPALALGSEKPTIDLMTQPPRKPDERLLNFSLMSRAYLFLGPIEAAAAMFGFFYVLYSGGWQWGTNLPANSTL